MPYQVLTNTQLSPTILELLTPTCEITLWKGRDTAPEVFQKVEGFFVYGHPKIDGSLMDLMPKLRVISNFGVGVDHINLADAQARGIADGARLRIFNDRGAFHARAVVTESVRRGVVVAPSVWWRKLSGDGENANAVTSPALTDLGGGPTFYDCLVEVEKETRDD